jgi:transposase
MRYITISGCNRSLKETNFILEDTKQAAVNAYTKGLSAEKAARIFGISKTALLDELHRKQISRSLSETRGITTHMEKRGVRLYKIGLSTRKVANRIGVDHGTILSWVRGVGICRSMSEAAMIRIEKDGAAPKRGIRSSFASSKTPNRVPTASLLELARAFQLDADAEVIEFSRASEGILYDCGRHRYLPDFKVVYANGDIVIEEIKPAYMLRSLTVKRKQAAALAHCNKHGAAYRIITEYEIGQSNFDRIEPSYITENKDCQRAVARALSAIRYGLKTPKVSRIACKRNRPPRSFH